MIIDIKQQKFQLNEKVVIVKTKSGISGNVVAVMPLFIFFSNMIDPKPLIDFWTQHLGDCTKDPCYLIYYVEIKKDSLQYFLPCHEWDLESHDSFWARAEKELANLP